jgi:hypothetical protein
MANVFQTEVWAIKVPDSWAVDESESSIAFAPRDDDSAALIASAFFKEDGEITMEEMRQAIESDAHHGSTATEVRIGDFTGYSGAYETNDENGPTAWRVWCVFNRDLHMYFSFNSPVSTKGQYDSVLDDMLRTVMCLKES